MSTKGISRKIWERGNVVLGTASLVAAALVALLLFFWIFFHTQTVEPGHEGVIVDKPYFFGSSGVRPEPLREGRQILWRTSSMVTVAVVPQHKRIVIDDFSSSDNILLDFESTIHYRINDSVRMVNEFGLEWFESNVLHQYLNFVREQIKQKSMPDMMSSPVAAQKVDDSVTAALVAMVESRNIPIEVLGVSLGRARPNPKVLEQMNETAAQQQRERTLVAAEAAERQREREQIAKAVADNAYRNRLGMTPEQFINKEINLRWAEACEKAPHCVITPGSYVMNLPAKR